MKVNSVIQTPEGIIQFKGELGQAEADAVVAAGLTYYLSIGAIAHTAVVQEEPEPEGDNPTIVEGNDTIN